VMPLANVTQRITELHQEITTSDTINTILSTSKKYLSHLHRSPLDKIIFITFAVFK